MIVDVSYWTRVFRRILVLAFTILGLFLAFKLSVFYMPFLVAFIISLMVEPLIRFLMKKTKASRKCSSIVIFVVVSAIILGALIWGIITLFSEASNLLQGLNDYVDKAYQLFQGFLNDLDLNKINVSDQVLGIIQNSTDGILNGVSTWVRGFLNGVINVVTSIPTISIYFVITVMALYFICVDKVYILDQIEHHVPSLWVKKVRNTHKANNKNTWRLLKSTSNTDISIIHSFIDRLIYFKICRICNRISIVNGTIYRLC